MFLRCMSDPHLNQGLDFDKSQLLVTVVCFACKQAFVFRFHPIAPFSGHDWLLHNLQPLRGKKFKPLLGTCNVVQFPFAISCMI